MKIRKAHHAEFEERYTPGRLATSKTLPAFIFTTAYDRVVPPANQHWLLPLAKGRRQGYGAAYLRHGVGLAWKTPPRTIAIVLTTMKTIVKGSAVLLSLPGSAIAGAEFNPGEPWSDSQGQPIEAHGGGILLYNGTYFWYGENHSLGSGNKTGISCYSSPDLVHWKNEGIVLPKEELPGDYRDSGVCERPK